MKRIAGFIVSKRYIVLIAAVVLCIVCAGLSLKVGINADLTKYLPDSSAMKHGMDIMNEEFPAMDMGQTIRVMAKDLDENGKAELLQKLKSIENVSSVTHNSSSDYNKDGYSLYVVNTSFAYGSDEEKAIESALATQFNDYNIEFKNDDMSDIELPMWLILLAVGIVIVILFLMCGSWFEPVLFLVTIGIAVIINAGTNIVLGSVSNVTQAISAIMQLILSMDYSIIMMNRYRQEKALCHDKLEAMKKAIANAFSSVAGSAFTTIVGLLMLVFMQFKIGFDIGVVLAKGVFISMICVFTVLPALILLCDKLITKTSKKELSLPTGALSRFSHKFRYVFTVLFVGLFIAFGIMQSRTQTAYSLEMADPIAEVFPQSNMVVMIYDNDDEETVAQMAQELESDPKINQILGYPNLLAKEYTSSEMIRSIDSLSTAFGVSMTQGMELDESMLRLIYYSHHNGKIQDVTMGDFISFLTEDIANNSAFSGFITDDMKAQLNQLRPFGDAEALTKPLSAKEIAAFFSMDEETAESMMLLYFSEKGGVDCGRMSMAAFADYIINDVSKNEMYASMFDEKTMEQINMLKTYTDKKEVTKPRGFEEMADMLGIEASQMRLLYTAYSDEDTPADIFNGASRELTLQQVINYVVENSGSFSAMMSEENMQQLPLAQKIINGTVEGTEYTPDELAELIGMDVTQLRQLYLLHITQYGDTSKWSVSVKNLLDCLNSGVLDRPEYATMIEPEMKSKLGSAQTMVSAVVSGKKINSTEMTSLLTSLAGEGMLDKATVELIYLFISSDTNFNTEWTLTIEKLFDHLSNDLVNDPSFSQVIGEDVKSQLAGAGTALSEGVDMLKGPEHSRMILQTSYPIEDVSTTALLDKISATATDSMDNTLYLIGNSPMAYEMSHTFSRELLFITILTALAIFIIVAISFRSLIIPAILVLLVQCGVFITITVIGWQGFSIYFLALLIVECILMGATIDYGILLTNYYRENRKKMPSREALAAAYKGSIHTIMTSGLIMVLVTAIISSFYSDPTVAQICRTISIGVFSAIILIVFILPGVLETFDKAITKERKALRTKSKTKESK